MQYINTLTGSYPVTLRKVRSIVHASLPLNPDDKNLEDTEFRCVYPSPKPVSRHTYVAPNPAPPGYVTPILYDSYTHRVDEGAPLLNIDGRYYQQWIINPLADEALKSQLEFMKAARIQGFKKLREGMANGTLDYDIYTLDCNLANRSNMHQVIDNMAILGRPDTETVTWKMGDNTFHVVTIAQLKTFGAVIGAHIELAFQKEKVAVEAVNACTDMACVMGVEW